MKTQAAVAFEAKQPLQIEEITIDGPKAGEVMVRLHATGVCHTDAYTLSGADPEGLFPCVLGHEGGGEVVEIGKGVMLNEGTDVTIFSTGHMVWNTVEAARALAKEGISCELINIHTIKPLDAKAILASANKTECIVTAEEHMRNGGLGDSIAQIISHENPMPIEYVAVNDSFGESGTPDQLMEKYGLNAQAIVAAAEKAMARKKGQN